MTLEQLFAEVDSLGLYVNNLFHNSEGGWNANLRDGNHGFEFGRGSTPQEALRKAIDKAKHSSHIQVAPRQESAEDLV
jgi:hypothetical protein